MEAMVSQEFSWLHVMNVSLGIATLFVMLFLIGAVLHETVQRLRVPRH